MKILHIDTGTDWRGGQRQVLTLHKGLIDHGIESTLICNRAGELYKKCTEENNFDTYHGFDFYGEFSIKTHEQIKKFIAQYKPIIIHCHDSHSVKLGDRFHHNHILFHTRRVSYPIKFLSRHLKYHHISMHICVSEDIRKYMEQYFKNTVTIHSCVDLNRFSSLSNSNILKNRKKLNVLYVGAFTNQKGVDVLIKAFSKIDLQHHDVALHLVGDGLLFNKMKQLIDSLNIEKYVNLYGARKDVEKFYLASDLIVCPSVSGEGSSGVIKEGMAAGKIVVASNLDANKELIDDKKSGLLFENSNSKELSTILLKIINNEINIPEKSIKDKIKQFECKHTINQHINIYKNIILKHM